MATENKEGMTAEEERIRMAQALGMNLGDFNLFCIKQDLSAQEFFEKYKDKPQEVQKLLVSTHPRYLPEKKLLPNDTKKKFTIILISFIAIILGLILFLPYLDPHTKLISHVSVPNDSLRVLISNEGWVEILAPPKLTARIIGMSIVIDSPRVLIPLPPKVGEYAFANPFRKRE